MSRPGHKITRQSIRLQNKVLTRTSEITTLLSCKSVEPEAAVLTSRIYFQMRELEIGDKHLMSQHLCNVLEMDEDLYFLFPEL